MLVRQRNAIAPTPLMFRLWWYWCETAVFLADSAHGGPSSTTWPVRGRGLCGEPGQNSSECFQFHSRCQKCQDYLWAGKWLLFSQDFDCLLIRGQNLTFTSIMDSFTSLRALFRKLSDIWGCSEQVYRLLLFKTRSTHFFSFWNSLVVPVKNMYG